jgi:hypothetical protein
VHDVCFGVKPSRPGKRLRLSLGDARANYRWFVRQNGQQRCYMFKPGDARTLEVELLRWQLAQSSYPAQSKFDPDTRTPKPRT